MEKIIPSPILPIEHDDHFVEIMSAETRYGDLIGIATYGQAYAYAGKCRVATTLGEWISGDFT